MKTILELKEELGRMYDQARAIVEKADTEKRATTEEEDTQYDDLVTRMDALRADIERREKLEGFTGVKKEQSGGQRGSQYHPTKTTKETANSLFLRRMRQPAGVDDNGLASEYRHAVAEEHRASNDTTMNITTAADGGDLVPTGHYNGIIERARPVALYDRLGLMNIPGTETTVNVPVDNEADSGIFVSTNESAAFDRDAPAVSKVAMTLVKYTKKVDLTDELMHDEDSRLMTFLNSYIASGFAATMNSLLVTEVLADGTAGLTLDAAAAIGAAEVPELVYKLSAEYAESPNVHWLMNRSTEGYLRGLRDTSLWTFAPNTVSGGGRSVNSVLWGIPAHSTSYVTAYGAGVKSLVVGDFSKVAYRLSPTMTFLRDPYTRSSYGEVILNYYFRCDFEVLQAGAIQYATHPTA